MGNPTQKSNTQATNHTQTNAHKQIHNKQIHKTVEAKGFHPSPVLKHTNTDFITLGAYVNMLIILVVMIGVMWGGFYILKKLGITKRLSNRKSPGHRLEIMDSIGVDTKTKLVLVRRDKNEHLLAINSQGRVTVVEQNIKHDPTPINFNTAIQDELKK